MLTGLFSLKSFQSRLNTSLVWLSNTKGVMSCFMSTALVVCLSFSVTVTFL